MLSELKTTKLSLKLIFVLHPIAINQYFFKFQLPINKELSCIVIMYLSSRNHSNFIILKQ